MPKSSRRKAIACSSTPRRPRLRVSASPDQRPPSTTTGSPALIRPASSRALRLVPHRRDAAAHVVDQRGGGGPGEEEVAPGRRRAGGGPPPASRLGQRQEAQLAGQRPS